jgi:hypothetical protein
MQRHSRFQTVAPITVSRALRSAGIARCPFTRRNLASARRSPATHQRRRMSPSRHRVSRAVTRRVTLSTLSIGLVVTRVRRNAPRTPSRTTSASPPGPPVGSPPRPRSPGPATAPSLQAMPSPSRSWSGGTPPTGAGPARAVLLGDVGLEVPHLVQLAPLDHGVLARYPRQRPVQGLCAIQYEARRSTRDVTQGQGYAGSGPVSGFHGERNWDVARIAPQSPKIS